MEKGNLVIGEWVKILAGVDLARIVFNAPEDERAMFYLSYGTVVPATKEDGIGVLLKKGGLQSFKLANDAPFDVFVYLDSAKGDVKW